MLAKVAIALIVGLACLVPVLLLRFPFQAGWANFVLDSIDGDLLIPLGLSDPTYQLVDKAADWVTYVFMVLAARRWPIWKWVVGFFAFRTVGQALFFISEDERVFFLFPNFLEPLFLIYATILFFEKEKERAHAFYLRHRVAIWIFIVLYKLQDEWVTHIGNIDRSDLVRRWLHI
jgi:hypothetical protein